MTGADARRIREALVDPAHTARLLGIETRARSGRRSIDVRCPFHDDGEASLSLFVGGDGTLGFRCHAPQCDIRGDVLRLIELRKSAASFREVLEIGDRLVGGAGLPPVPPRVKETRPPSAGAIRRVVAKCGSTSNDAEVSAWLRARALDASAIDSTGAAHALAAAGGGLPSWARFWPSSGHRLIMLAYNPHGVVATVRARRVVDGSGRRKVLAPEAGSTTGVVLANPGGLALLRGDAGAPRRIVIAEGETDLLSLPANDVAGLGLIARDSWTPEFARACAGREVVIATDDDAGGDAYARDLIQTIAGRSLVRDINATTREHRAAGHPLASSGDLNDLLVAGVDLSKLFERARVVSDPDSVAAVAQEQVEDDADETDAPVAQRETPDVVKRSVAQALRYIERTPKYVILDDIHIRVLRALIGFAWWHRFEGPLGQRVGQCQPRVDTLAKSAGVSERHLQRQLDGLSKRGVVRLEKFGGVEVRRRSNDARTRDITHLWTLPEDVVAAGMAGRT